MNTKPSVYLLAFFPLLCCSCAAPSQPVSAPPQRLRVGMELNEALEACRFAGLKPYEFFSQSGMDAPVTEFRQFQIDSDRCADAFQISVYRCSSTEPFTVHYVGWYKNWKSDSALPRGQRKHIQHRVVAIDLSKVIARLNGKHDDDETENSVRSVGDAIKE